MLFWMKVMGMFFCTCMWLFWIIGLNLVLNSKRLFEVSEVMILVCLSLMFLMVLFKSFICMLYFGFVSFFLSFFFVYNMFLIGVSNCRKEWMVLVVDDLMICIMVGISLMGKFSMVKWSLVFGFNKVLLVWIVVLFFWMKIFLSRKLSSLLNVFIVIMRWVL